MKFQSGRSSAAAALMFLAVLLLPWQAAQAQYSQQAKLVGTGAVGQGATVALSADGNTAILGAPGDNSGAGAVLVFTRTNGVWRQQGHKLVGSGAVGAADQGWSVALSADGNTAIVGGPYDDSSMGAAWIFTRTGKIWAQQGGKLVGSGGVRGGNLDGVSQGTSVALSADGNTAIIGGTRDDDDIGAVWVFTRSNGAWTQQGNKLVATDFLYGSEQGDSVAISADGNTALVGGPGDNGGIGAAFVFTRSGGTWSQQGSKLVGTDSIGESFQGDSVALSADGNTAIIGGDWDNNDWGAEWVFARKHGVWSQQSNKLIGSGATPSTTFGYKLVFQGENVTISGDGNTAMVGGQDDSSGSGAIWEFTRASNGTWRQLGQKFRGTGAIGSAGQSPVALSSDGSTAIVGGPYDNSSTGAAWIFVRKQAKPVVTSVTPNKGPARGGTNVIITGANFTGATAVKFGSTPAKKVVVRSATKITAQTPRHAAGKVTVTVTTPAGAGSKTRAFTFTR